MIPDDPLALPIVGKKERITRVDWLKFAAYCQLPERAAVGVLQKQAAAVKPAMIAIDRSFLPVDQKEMDQQLISERACAL